MTKHKSYDVMLFEMKLSLNKGKKFIRQIRASRTLGKNHSLKQLLNIIMAGVKYGFSPLEYYLYGFDNKRITKEERLTYISNDRIETFLRPTLNNRRWTPIIENKLLFYLFFSKLGLPVVKVYGYYYPKRGFSLDGTLIRDTDDFLKWVQKAGIKKLVIKPVGSLGGKGIKIFEDFALPDLFTGADGKVYTVGDIISFMDEDIKSRQRKEDPYMGFILEERIEQAEEMNVLNSTALNTIRVSTLQTKQGEVTIDFAMLRIGCKGSITDNLHQGGYVVNINVQDGSLDERVLGYKGEAGPWVESKDIYIKKLFNGGKLPEWGKITELAKRAAVFSPNLFSIGWDIALSKSGVVLMEGNGNWDMVIAQVLSGGYLNEKRRKILKEYRLGFP